MTCDEVLTLTPCGPGDRVGLVETQTVKLVSEVRLVVTLWRQERHQVGFDPHCFPTVVSKDQTYTQTLSL